MAEAIEDAAAVEAASDAAIEESFEERVSDALDEGLEGEALEEAVAEASADADVQESIADAAIVQALEETVAEAVEDATAVEALSDAAILGGLADTVESIAADVEQAEATADGEPGAVAEPAETPNPLSSPSPRESQERRRVASGRGARRHRGRARSVPRARRLVRRAHVRRLREQGQDEPRVAHPHDADGGQDLRRPHPDGGRHGDQGGKKQVVQRKVFPGYLLVKMVYDNDSWYVVRNTPGVTGFVAAGTGSKPTPLSRREVEKILSVKKEEVKPQFRLGFEENDVVRIISGPFADFNGTISEINLDQSKLKVLVNIFDRETPVELSFDQVAKV